MYNLKNYFRCTYVTLCSFILVGIVYAKKPHASALNRTGIRVVGLDDPSHSGAADEALILLEANDNEMFLLVKKHIRMILLYPTDLGARPIPTGRLYRLYAGKISGNLLKKNLPVQIGASLAKQAAMAELNGWIAQFDKVKGASIIESCQRQERQTFEKLKKAFL